MVAGEPALGKSKILQQLTLRLGRLEDVTVGVMERPQSSVGDPYREMGALFGVNLSPANRYGGFKALRGRWSARIKTALMRPLLLIDEAQEMVAARLNEPRLPSGADFDSQSLLTVVLSGDMRLSERFRLVERPWAVMRITRSRFPNVVALMRTTLSQALRSSIASARSILPMLDGDPTGARAASSILNTLPAHTQVLPHQLQNNMEPEVLSNPALRSILRHHFPLP